MNREDRDIVVFDIDNCLADDVHRITLIKWSATDLDERYNAYHNASYADPVGNLGTFMLETETHKRYPVFITARPEPFRVMTARWLEKNLGVKPGEYDLFMREPGDRRPSEAVKLAAVSKLSKLPAAAYDDLERVCAAYRDAGIPKVKRLFIHEKCALTPPMPLAPPTRGEVMEHFRVPPTRERTPADLLEDAARTFRERNAAYGGNYMMIAPLVRILFPNGVPPELVTTHRWHLFELKLVKLSRFATSGLSHIDSIRDDAVYSAMIESLLHHGDQP